MGKREFGNYYLGLDIGTNSVGWAVTDNQYRILKMNGKTLWGIRLFEEGQKADERRSYRSARRRIQRKESRIKILQELFANEIAQRDPGFFQRLRDSKYYEEDKLVQQSNTLFFDQEYTDKEYHKEFPTVYHLRKALIEEKKEYDVRLVYLALHHIVKHRGHFLFEGQEMSSVTSFDKVYEDLIQYLCDEFDRTDIECTSIEDFQRVLTDKKITRTNKEKQLKTLFEVEKTDKQLTAVVGLLAGTTKKLSDLYKDEELDSLEKPKVCFADAGYDESRETLEDSLEDRIYLLDKIKAVYDWAVLTDVLQGEQYLSFAKVDIYEKHKKDLKILKDYCAKYIPEQYDAIFREANGKTPSYCAYVGMTKKNNKKLYVEKKCTQEELCGHLLKLFKGIDIEEDDFQYMMHEVEMGTFLPKQVSKDNGVIPYQVHEQELKVIIKNASRYLGFLNEKDETGFSVSEKIIKTFRFRIPYYVGPLNDAHKNEGSNTWLVKKKAESIKPWNFEEVVDLEASAEEFIKRMTNKCTYLVGEDVLPKNSLLYSEFMVLNEINNIRINQEKIPVELKQKIYNHLFKKHKKVTAKKLRDFLKTEGYEVSEDNLSGFDGDFKASLSSYLDFKAVFGGDIDKYEFQVIAEQIILWSCLYGDDKKLLSNKIKKEYGKKLSAEQLKKIAKKKYTGWGRLSRAFLCDIEGASKETGEVRSIIQSLRETNDNLMMLLSQNYTYLETIDAHNHVGDTKVELTYELVKELYVSPAVKHMLWQTLKVVKELASVMGHEPEKVFIEMARGEDERKQRTVSRKAKLSELYEACKDDTRDWLSEIDNKNEGAFRSDRLYLYYTQQGKCMYTGKQIPLEKLFDTNLYDIDHIYPQSKTKDDSLDNRVLVERITNAKKDNTYPVSLTIQKNQAGFWKYLREHNFISKKKYDRLMRTSEFTDQELAGFIARQIVETQQTMKATADLLKKVYTNSQIVYVKARLVSDFRRAYNMLKVREVNDYHHAKDAYLNIVVGNVYHTKFTSNPIHFIEKYKNTAYTISNVYEHDVERNGYTAWKAGSKGTIYDVKKVMEKNNILYTRASFEGKGGLFKQTFYSKKICTPQKYVPLKAGDDKMLNVQKYGGYTSVANAYFFAVEHTGKKGEFIKTIEFVPAYIKSKLRTKEELKHYCECELHMKNVRILIDRINVQSLIKVDGFYLFLTARSGNNQLKVSNAVQFCVDMNWNNYIKRLYSFMRRNAEKRNALEVTEFDKITKEMNKELYLLFIDKYTNTIFSRRPNLPNAIFSPGKERFERLDIKEQIYVLLQILQLSQYSNQGADFSLIGGKSSGVMTRSKEISKYKEFIIVNQSVTGIFENQIDLLKI